MTSTLLQWPAEGVADPPGLAHTAATSFGERALIFPCEGEQLMGVLHLPAEHGTNKPAAVGVVVVVGGPQVRAGSHRQFVLLARALAAAGHPVLRFDVRGMGDSTGELRNFEQIGPDISAAIDTLLAAQPQLQGVVLWGLCDGASAALLYLHERGGDERVRGLCMLNPWVRSEQTLAQVRVRHYYWHRLRQREFWSKLLRGGVGLGAGLGLLRQIRRARLGGREPAGASFQQRMLLAWRRFDGPILLVLSGRDLTAQEFLQHAAQTPGWDLGAGAPRVQIERFGDGDHTFATPQHTARMQTVVVDWIHRLSAAEGRRFQ